MENPTPKKAPRVPPSPGSLAAAAAKPTRRQIIDAIAEHRDFRGFMPFSPQDSNFAVERCNRFISEASCLLDMLSAACEDAAELGERSEFDLRSSRILAGALEGVATLVDLAGFYLEDPERAGELA